jgi:hypothetical protein
VAGRPIGGSGRTVVYHPASMRVRRSFILTAILALLALPGTALAQSASNDQYSDPFGDGTSQSDGGGGGGGTKTSGGGSSNSSGGGSSQSSGGSSSGSSGGGSSDSSGGSESSGVSDSSGAADTGLSSAPQAVTSTAGTTGTAGATSTGKQLPNTGIDLRLLAGLGVALLLMGIGLRLRTADDRRF